MLPFVRKHVNKTSITTIIIALAITLSLFSSATVFKPNAQIAFGSGSGSGSGESEIQSSSSDENEKQSTDESNKQSSSSSSSDENKKKQVDDDEKKVQDDEKKVQDDVVQIQYDVTKLEADEKQIKIDLSTPETLGQGKAPQTPVGEKGEKGVKSESPQGLQNPSIQQSLEASKQQQPNPGKLATPPNVLAQYEADKAKLQADQNKLTSDLGTLQADENNYTTHINALAFNACKQGETSNLCIR